MIIESRVVGAESPLVRMIKAADPIPSTGPNKGPGLTRTVILSAHGFRVSRTSGYAAEPTIRVVNLESSENVVFLSLRGSMLFRSRSMDQTCLLASHSSVFAVGLKGLACFYTRGHHNWIEIDWHSEQCQALNSWVMETTGHDGTPTLAAKSLLGSRAVSDDRITQFISALEQDWETCKTSVQSFAHEVVGALVSEPGNGLLTSIPHEANPILRSLMASVKKSPEASWALKDASEMAGYSAFHLSRSFRSLVGFGFPEYVDRCRTEVAIKMLIESEEMIDEIAKVCGFGSTQALRSATREYTGLLPSEFRQLPQSRLSFGS